MNPDIKAKLLKSGWKTGSTKDFLKLTNEEMQLIELRIALGKYLREKREARGYTQVQFSKEIKTSQSRVAKMESGNSSVDLLLKSIFHLVPGPQVCKDLAGFFR